MKDFSKLTDEELLAIANAPQEETPQQDFSQLSDEELIKIAGSQPQRTWADKVNEHPLIKGLATAYDFTAGLPQALGNKLIGSIQAGTTLTGNADSEFSQNLGKEVGVLLEKQSKLPAGERAGIAIGQVLPEIALMGPSRLFASGATAGLTTPLEDPSISARLGETAKDAALSYVGGKAIEGIGAGVKATTQGVKNIIKGTKATELEQLPIIAGELKEAGSQLYKQVANAGTVLRPSAVGSVVKKITSAVSPKGTRLAPHLHGDTIDSLKYIQDDIASKGGKISLPELDEYRQLLSQTIKKNTTKLEGANPDAAKSTLALKALDDIVEKLHPRYLVESGDPAAVELLNQARKQWSKASKFERIANIAEASAGDPNLIKRNLFNFIKNKNNLRGFTGEEKDALKKAATLSAGEGTLKALGKFGLDLGSSITAGNTALPVVGAAVAGFQGGLSGGGATIAAGTAARQAQKYIARGKLDDALKIIAGTKNPVQAISKIPNRKLQKKLVDEISKTATLTTTQNF